MNESKEIKKLFDPTPIPTYELKSHLIGSDLNTDVFTCMTNDNLDTGTWTIINDTFDNFNLFSLLTTGASIYFGSSSQSVGMYMNVVQSTTENSQIICEFWNGSAWTTLNTMSSLASKPFYTYGSNYFARMQSEIIMFGLTSGWTQNTLNSLSNYWIRFRVTSTLSSNIILNVVTRALTTLEIDVGGFIHQRNPIVSSLPIALRGITATPTNTFIGSFPITGLNFLKASVCDASITLNLIRGTDTSKGLNFYWGWMNPTATGNVKWEVRAIAAPIGVNMFSSAQSPPANEINVTQVVTTTPGTYMSSMANIPINNLILKNTNGSTDALCICLTRMSTDAQDTVSDNVTVFQSNITSFTINLGVHPNFF